MSSCLYPLLVLLVLFITGTYNGYRTNFESSDPDIKTCKDGKGNTRKEGDRWNESLDCNTCTCRCKWGAPEASCECSNMSCKPGTCNDRKRNTRKQGENWIERFDCNICKCSCEFGTQKSR